MENFDLRKYLAEGKLIKEGQYDSYYQMTAAKRLAAKDGYDFDKLPKYDRTSNKHQEYYLELAKGLNENEKPSTKISKSALKEMIKAAMLGEAKKDEEEVDAEAEDTEEVDIEAGAEETAGPELSGDVKTISDSLEAALEAARAMGDEKLVNQIGNTITFFTRAHIVGGGEGSMGLEEMDNLENEEY